MIGQTAQLLSTFYLFAAMSRMLSWKLKEEIEGRQYFLCRCLQKCWCET